MIKSVVFIAFIAALGGFLFGYDTGVISGAILFIQKDLSLTNTEIEILVGAVLGGAVLGAFLSGGLSDWLGRKKLLICTALLFGAASIFTALSVNYIMLIIGRIFVGIAIGVSSMISPLYIAEVAPAKHRGALVALNQFAITIGIVISYSVDLGFAEIGSWRWMMGVAAFPAVVLLIGMFFMPDSPRWLIFHGFRDQAKVILTHLRGNEEAAEKETAEIETHIKEKARGWKGAITPWVKHALIIGIGLAIFQQLTGINTVIYYAPKIFQLAGFHSDKVAILATVCVGLVNVFATVFALWLLDRVGRRRLLLIGLAGMVISLIILAFTLRNDAHETGYLTLISLALYVASFAIGLGPVFWVLIAEIYPMGIRAKAMSLAAIANWGANLLVALTFLTLLDSLGSMSAFLLYAGIGVISWFFSFFLVPETKGLTLEEIQNKELHSL